MVSRANTLLRIGIVHAQLHQSSLAGRSSGTVSEKRKKPVNNAPERLATEWAVQAAAATHQRHDSYTALHSHDVSRLAADIGRRMGLTASQIWLLALAGLVHDIGLIEVPRSILDKPGVLTAAENDQVRIHPEAGYRVLNSIPTPWPIAEIARQHHELLDGSGYPHGLKGSEILFEAQVLAVADLAQSMLAWRPYRPGYRLDYVLEHLNDVRGKWLNAAAVDACIELLRRKDYELPSGLVARPGLTLVSSDGPSP